MKKQEQEWILQEFPDAKELLKKTKFELMFEVWKGRSNKWLLLIIGLAIGLLLGRYI